MSRSPLGHRAPVLWLLLPFMAGLIAGKFSLEPLPVSGLLAASLSAVVLALTLAARRPAGWAMALPAGLAALGAAYYEIRRERLPDWDVLPTREARLRVQVTRAFAAASPDHFSGIGRIIGAEPHLRDLHGQPVALSLKISPEHSRPARSSVIAATGVLEVLPRRAPPDDGFARYLVGSGINFRLRWGLVEDVLEPRGIYPRWRERLRMKAKARLGLGLESQPDRVSALRGMLLGERGGLRSAQKDLYLRSGAMHLFAISGLHIGVIALGIIGMLRFIRVPPFARFLVGSVMLAFYVDLTGALPSAVRAWMMVVCLQAASILRVPGNPVSALATSALLVLVIDPMQLFGAGFQMSYAIVAALLLYGLPLRECWIARGALWRHLPTPSWTPWHRASSAGWQWLQSAVAINVAASLAATISSVAFFEILTPGAILANLLLIPLASATIIAGFASLAIGCIGLAGACVLLNRAAAVILALMECILRTFAATPGAAHAARFRAEWFGSAALACLVAAMAWGYAGRWRSSCGGYWLPVACLAIALVLGLQFD